MPENYCLFTAYYRYGLATDTKMVHFLVVAGCCQSWLRTVILLGKDTTGTLSRRSLHATTIAPAAEHQASSPIKIEYKDSNARVAQNMQPMQTFSWH